MKKIDYRSIGIIHSPFKTPKGTPIQPNGAIDIDGTVEVFAEFAEGLADLEGFSHLYLIYHFHLAKAFRLRVRPFLSRHQRGLFATRAPSRPNPIGLSVVRLVSVSNTRLHIRDVDIVDNTPLLDIKPYVPEFDVRQVERIGWLEAKSKLAEKTSDDGRFSK
jgi:tRNA-Thr(GGU) m(6)t(6)A37 methyltransferase TsaA